MSMIKFGDKWRKCPNKYVCGAKDPRKIPLNQCASLGDLMATLERCRELDKQDRKKGKKK